jgi:PAS domain S-box-containing protein
MWLSAIHPEHLLCNAANVRSWHRQGLAVVAWTADEEVDLQRCCAAGVDAVITNRPAATLRVIGKPLEEVIGKDDREHYKDPAVGEALMANDRRIMESGKAEVIEEVGQTPEGYRTFISTKTPYRNSKGEVIGILGVSQDITERKQAEEQLARQADLLSMVCDGVWAVDAEFRFTYWNKGAERILGWTAEEALGKVANDLLKTRFEGASRDESIKKMLQDGHYEGEASYLHKDGYYVPVEVNFSVVKGPDGETRGLIVTGRDITERKRAEEALRVSEERYRRIVEMANEGIWTMDRDNVTTFVNPRMALMLGYSQEEIVGRMPYDFLDDAYREEVRNHLDNRRRGARGQYTCKYLRKDGSDLWAIVSGTPLYDGNGAYTGLWQ